ncbi:hypothetical protein [Paenibacillus ginsengihumi]|uniref:hypothetical protein n=1 Tax=Paenibacillus ginsengihumi TaxID=431596 RepID=UPI0003760C79|nr:hypothetical protein [Paenibacillus ginsengihumi]
MIGPLWLRGALVAKFQEHLQQVPYAHVVCEGRSLLSNESRLFSASEAQAIVNRFVQSNFPIVCFAGSKSRVPFFDYHIAVNYGNPKHELAVCELLAREPVQDNAVKAVLMAFYRLVNEKYGADRLHVPFRLADAADGEIGMEASGDGMTILYRKK